MSELSPLCDQKRTLTMAEIIDPSPASAFPSASFARGIKLPNVATARTEI